MIDGKDEQLPFDDMYWRTLIPKDSVYGRLYDWAEEFLNEEIFAPLFSGIERPSVSPVRTFRSILLQFALGYSDQEMQRATRLDMQVKHAINVPLNSLGVDAVTLCEHRKLFFEKGLAQKNFHEVLRFIEEPGFLGEKALSILDSFIVQSAAEEKDTYTLLRTGTIKTLHLARCFGVRINESQLHEDYTSRGKPKIKGDNPVKQQCFTNLVLDALCVVEQVESSLNTPLELKDLVKYVRSLASPDGILEGEQGVRC